MLFKFINEETIITNVENVADRVALIHHIGSKGSVPRVLKDIGFKFAEYVAVPGVLVHVFAAGLRYAWPNM